MSGRLVLVATPIGNLGDIAPRAVTALAEADLILAEDTRRTGRLLQHLDISTPQLSFHEHNERERLSDVLERLRSGDAVALVTDAGMPTVSDPGYRLVAACHEHGVEVTAIPGPSAVTMALALSGLPTDRFVFEGFLPRKGAARRERLETLAGEPRTVVLFLSPHRAAADLEDLGGALGPDRPATLLRELTKLHEEVSAATLEELRAGVADGVQGEMTLVVAGAPPDEPEPVDDEEAVRRVRELIATGVSKKEAIASVAERTGRPKREIYQAVVDAGS